MARSYRLTCLKTEGNNLSKLYAMPNFQAISAYDSSAKTYWGYYQD